MRRTWMIIPMLGAIMCAMCGPRDPDEIRAALVATIPEVVARGNSPSTQVAVVHRDRVIWSGAFGENASPDRIYMNASVQKVFDAVGVLQLVERGLVDLDGHLGDYVPFAVRHPDFPEAPVTVRMLLAHRSGLDSFPNQFCWDTEAAFSPAYRPSCPDVHDMSLEEYLVASLTPEGSNYVARAWVSEPGSEYHYSISSHPLLRYMVERVTGQSFPDYMHRNVFLPLNMTSSGFSAADFPGRHAVPYTRIDGENIELPIWSGNGYMMRSTAEDMAKFMIAMLNKGRYGENRLLEPGTIELMQQRTTRWSGESRDLLSTGHGLGLFVFRDGWFGHGGSAPGFQCLWRFNPSKQVGYVILCNVNAILGGGDNYDSVREDIYSVQDALISIL